MKKYGVPCSHLKMISDIPCTREDEAVALAVGAWFTGREVEVFMQNSGFGNCVDIITSLLIPYNIPIKLHISIRAAPEHHAFMGLITKQLGKLLTYEKHIQYH